MILLKALMGAAIAVGFIVLGLGAATVCHQIASPARDNVTSTDSDGGYAPGYSGSAAADVLISSADAKPAPALTAGKWINSEPLTAEHLRGHVVLLEFWTFGCYNCINTLPAIKGYDAKYRDKGLTIIGIETPETEAEKSFDNLTAAVKRRGIEYPVLTDYNNGNWNAFEVEAWPTIIILDKQGRIRYTHVGEGAYDTQEKVIQTLLSEGAKAQRAEN